MTKETYDILYNKKAEDLTKNDIEYIKNCLWNKGVNLFSALVIPCTIGFGALVGGLMSLIPGAPSLVFQIGLGVGLFASPIFFVISQQIKNPLGLTKKEWKELKKSGRLKELKKLIKTCETVHQTELSVELNSSIEETKVLDNQKESLINKIIELSNKLGIEYSHEEGKNLLVQKESLLLKSLERLKKEKEELSKIEDNKELLKKAIKTSFDIANLENSLED